MVVVSSPQRDSSLISVVRAVALLAESCFSCSGIKDDLGLIISLFYTVPCCEFLSDINLCFSGDVACDGCADPFFFLGLGELGPDAVGVFILLLNIFKLFQSQ